MGVEFLETIVENFELGLNIILWDLVTILEGGTREDVGGALFVMLSC